MCVCVCLILLPYRQASRRSASFLAFVVLLLLGVYLGKRYQMRLEMKPYANTPRTRQKSISTVHFSSRHSFVCFRSVYWNSLSSKSSVVRSSLHNSQQQQQHIPTREQREIKLHPPPTFLFLLLLLLVWLFDAIYIYKTDRQRKCSLFLLLRRRRPARVFSIAPFRAANEEEKSRDFREDASVTAKTFASSRRHRRR